VRCERGEFSGHRVPKIFNCLRKFSEGGARRFMLPGFRFLLAAIILSTSMLVFGLGAAALLRAAHEQFASNPSWHAAPEATFAQQQAEPVTPVLAMLHAEPPAAGLKTPDNVSALNILAVPIEQATNVATPAEPTAVSPAAPEQASGAPAASPSDRVAALKPEQTSAPEPATPAKAVVAQDLAPRLPAPAQNEAPAAEASGSSTYLSQSDSTLALTKQAAIAPVRPQANETVANEAAAAETAPTETAPAEGEANAAAATAAAEPAMDAISTKLTMLDSRGVIVQPKPRPTAAIARSEQATKKRRAAARRIAEQTRQVMAPALLFPPFPQHLNQPPGVPNH
jgi:hypothetical protein